MATLTPSYDTKGNLTSDGTLTFGYDSESKMVQTSTGGVLGYEPLGRLAWIGVPTPALAYDWDGTDIVAERNASTGGLFRRFVYGPGAVPGRSKKGFAETARLPSAC